VPLGNEALERFERAGIGAGHVGGREKLIEQRRIADDRASVGQSEEKLRVVCFESSAFGDLTNVVTDGQAQIPERIEERVQEPLVVGADDAGEEHQQVHIRVQAHLAPAVATEGEDRYRLGQRSGIGIELLDEGIHPVRVLTHRMASAFAAAGGLRKLAARSLEPRGSGYPRLMAQVRLGEMWVGGHQM
jgi:hypothetical protein